MHSDEKLVAILDGQNWTDASVEFLVVPADLDLSTQHDFQHQQSPDTGFDLWLVQNAHARYARSDEVEQYAVGTDPLAHANEQPKLVAPRVQTQRVMTASGRWGIRKAEGILEISNEDGQVVHKSDSWSGTAAYLADLMERYANEGIEG